MAARTPTMVGDPVAEGVGRIPGFVNSYVVQEAEGWSLIDTGFARKAGPIVRAFQDAQVPLAGVRRIVLTHHHVDHMGGAAYLVENAPAELACHQDDAAYVSGRARAPMPWLMRLFLRVHPAPVALVLKDGDRVGPWQVIHTPGHTPGEIVLYDPARRILFGGDAVRERNGVLGLPATRYASDLPTAVRSLERLQGLDVRLLLPGHGEPVGASFAALLDDLVRRAPHEILHR